MDENFIRAIDGYWYRIKKSQSQGGLCILCKNGKYYTVYPDRYIIGIDNHLFKLINKNSNGGIEITGQDHKQYFVENNPISFRVIHGSDHLNDFKCGGPNPCPTIKLDGVGSYKCDDKTGICDIDVPEGTRYFIGGPKSYRRMFDGKTAWLERK